MTIGGMTQPAPAPLSWTINTLSPLQTVSTKPVRTAGIVERSLTGDGKPADPIPAGARIMRRWEGAQTDRLNEAQWAGAHGTPIDVDLASDLTTLRARAAHEYHNNPIVEGLVTTHAVDVVGSEGPSLEVVSDDDQYNQELQDLFAEWAQMCDYNGELSLVDILQLWVRQQWTAGSLLGQEVTDQTGSLFPVTYRVHVLHADRLETPWGMQGDPNVAFGIRRTQSGRPLTYYISQPRYFGPYRMATGEFDPIPADMIYHGFIRSEPGQSVGYPLLASALPTIADLRSYDQSVLDAARLAADRSEWFVNIDPQGEKFLPEDGTSFEVAHKRMVTRAAPPGWDVRSHDATHPTAQYADHRKERMAELGRAAAMPLMLIRLDSSQHNYSSARFDHQGYCRHVESWQAWLGRTVLNRMCWTLAREASLSRVIRPKPERAKLYWNWQPPPKGDPVKERAAERMGLQNRTLTFADACRLQNLQEEEVIASWARTRKRLVDAGFTPEEIAAFMGTVARLGPGASGPGASGPGSRQPNDARPKNDPANRPQTENAKP